MRLRVLLAVAVAFLVLFGAASAVTLRITGNAVGGELEHESGAAAPYVVPVLLVHGTLAFLLFAALLLFSRRFRHALRGLERTAREFAHGRLTERARLGGVMELHPTAAQLNAVAERFSQTLYELRSQRNELEAVLSGMMEGVVVLDRELKIRSINQAAAQLFEIESHKAPGRTVLELFRNHEIAEFAQATLASEEPVEQTVMLYGRNRMELQLHGNVLGNPGNGERGAVIVMNDISRVRRLESVRRDFVSNVSHELKTPVTSILGFVETLVDGAAEDPERRKEFLDIVQHHAARLNLIIEDLLSLSRLETADERVPLERRRIYDIVERCRLSSHTAATSKQIDVMLDIAGDPSARVNESLLEQALNNLIDNAIKYSNEGDSITVEVREKDGRLLLSVSDTGPGIPAEELPRIFERFYRVDRTRSRELGGTGLGLAIVKHIARAHGGDVTVSSTLDSGSTFTIWIPRG